MLREDHHKVPSWEFPIHGNDRSHRRTKRDSVSCNSTPNSISGRYQSPRRPSRFASRPVEDFVLDEFTCSTPLKCGTRDGTLRYHDQSGRVRNDSLKHLPATPPPSWKKIPSWRDKYVDDANVGEHHHKKDSTAFLSTERESRLIHATDCQATFNTIKTNVNTCGMKVNDRRT